MKEQKKGISLIVLVITITVMLILASAVIITLSNSNIINKAKEAVNKTDEAIFKAVLMGESNDYIDMVNNYIDAKLATM